MRLVDSINGLEINNEKVNSHESCMHVKKLLYYSTFVWYLLLAFFAFNRCFKHIVLRTHEFELIFAVNNVTTTTLNTTTQQCSTMEMHRNSHDVIDELVSLTHSFFSSLALHLLFISSSLSLYLLLYEDFFSFNNIFV